MDYAVGDELISMIAAINPSKTDEVLFPVGTVVTIESFKGKLVNLKFPDGLTYAHEKKDLLSLFKKKTEGKVLVNMLSGVGTPPQALFSMLPKGADWKKNHVWKVVISLEEKNDKHIICQTCTTEITDLNNKNSMGDIYCTGCKTYVIPFDLKNNKPYSVEVGTH